MTTLKLGGFAFMSHKMKLVSAAVAGLLASAPAFATNGYAPHGIGMHAKGMGGVGIAFAQDAVSIGQNPASSAWVGNRVDVGVDYFRPIRDAKLSNTDGWPYDNMQDGFSNGSFDGSGKKNFFIPEIGYNRVIDDQWSAGVSVFGNGGMNTQYDDGIPLFNAMTGRETGINLEQLFIVPTVAFKINERHSIGLGINLVAQNFEAKGLQAFAGTPPPPMPQFAPFMPYFSNDPDKVTDNGKNWSYGAGFRVGWTGHVNDMVTLGAYYSSRTWMGEFDDYKGLFAEQGGFDIPQNLGVGIAVQATPELTIAADIMWIDYSSVASISNEVGKFYGCPALGAPTTSRNNCLGGDDGPGFGWDDMTVFKIGAQYRINDEWTVRAGWNYSQQPIPESQTMFNILAPATVENHLTLGASWNVTKDQELTFAYMHAFENEVKGEFTPGFGTADIKMSQDSFGIQYSWKL